jgi:hypothetical protein
MQPYPGISFRLQLTMQFRGNSARIIVAVSERVVTAYCGSMEIVAKSGTWNHAELYGKQK